MRPRSLLVLALALSSFACSSSPSEPAVSQEDSGVAETADSTPETSPEPPAAPKCGGFASANTACQACLEAKCCDVATKCGGDPACTDNLRALRSCTSIATCAAIERTDAASALDRCLWKSCGEPCAGSATDGINHFYKGVGDPCTGGDSCMTGKCSIAHQCVRTCASDADCGGYPDVDGKAVQHVCVKTQKAEKLCLPRCETSADCSKLVVTFPAGLVATSERLTCADVGASHKACILSRDKGPTPGCYPNDTSLGGRVCESDDECLCGTQCNGHACDYDCTDNASCTSVSNGLFNSCSHGSSYNHCSQ